MAKFNSIQTYFLKRDFEKKHGRLMRNRKFFNPATAKTFGVVFDASQESDYNRVSSFVRHLQANNKKVKAMGYISYKDLPHYVMQTISYDFIMKKDLNPILKPNNIHALDFIKSEFDILVDFNMDNNPVLRYISGLSMAKFKIGLLDKSNEEIFDFMLQGIDKGNMAGYAKEVLHYLEILQPDTK